MAQDWDGLAKNWESNPATEQFAQSVFAQLQQLTQLDGIKVLDFGCGTGQLSQLLSPIVKDIVALDASEAMIEELDKKELLNVEPVVDALSRGLVAQHPAFRGQFDLVVASSVLAFVDDVESSLDIAHSLLNEGGYFVHFDWVAESEQDGFTLSRSENALSNAGFVDVEAKKVFDITSDGQTMSVLMGVGRR
ncbi:MULTISPECIES: class I SAM-dependent DNA methyltransferase [Vibrio]|uniref:Class I SAM-dependent methyltransferase n=7 Tax=Vibrio TaxID=662 RepID=A0A7H5CW94_VIBPH|nr:MULTISPECIES: methyltransferase domain-containing protein [Vibrio]EJG0919300.1 class I SAM-dependent methyltransferase [Vibrio parahaemolyticus O1:K68]EJG0929809.1 class I SAM-dependent methyltransferase [Vibrio parahaemolyticus O1]EJG0943125.1 class I SAM-dependent methyltransferase [Vibrio parahaemolyticus O10]EQM41338.1 methyltransferase domain protein [Vibrio parahaemolyticus VPCR-2010]KIT43107.1 SAM-dependent methyltransferase [Vibrio parahaemolyticus 49]RFD43241.1 SAM-dependent methy